MSYTDAVKKEILSQNMRLACDRRAAGAGIAYALLSEGGTFALRLPDSEVADVAAKLLRERFGKDAQSEVLQSGQADGRVILSFSLPSSAQKRFLEGDIAREFRCEGCSAAFMKGVFVAAGTVSDPQSKAYHAEFLLRDAARAGKIYGVLEGLGSSPKIINRKNSTGLYFKSSAAIEDLLVKLGANNAAFELMNRKIERTIRNEENRATNCVARNISKTVAASRRQVEDIELLRDKGVLDTLPYDLRVTAKLRLENPEASLAELASLHVPPISKSGLNHRLEKLSLSAEKIRESKH